VEVLSKTGAARTQMEPQCDDKEGWGQAFILGSTDNEEELRGNISAEGGNLPGGSWDSTSNSCTVARWF